jgi:DNA-binding transcriptional regulator WhiA
MDILSDYCFQCFACLIGIIAFTVLFFEWKGLIMQDKLKEAIKTLLDSDCCVVVSRKHLSKRRNEYVIYHFDRASNIGDEDVYTEADKAISAFCDYVAISDAIRGDDDN